MRRPSLRLAAMLFVMASACDVGSVVPPGGDEVDASGASGPDGGAGSGGDGGGGPDGPAVACEPAAVNLPNGEHRPGEACLTCHTGNGAPLFRLGGTVYATAQGGALVPGATIVVTDASNVVTRLITASNGNFYSNQAFAFPVRVSASKCPDTRPMIATVQTAGGDCNSCHQAGATGRVYLP